MHVWNDRPILVADPHPERADELRQLLRLMDFRVNLATTAMEVLDAIRSEIVVQAVVAVEMTIESEPALECLRRLPTLRCLVAIGPPANPETELRARRCGGRVYLMRPVDIKSLAVALYMPGIDDIFAKPP